MKNLKNHQCIMPAKLVVVKAHIRMCPRFFIVVLSIVLICMKRKFYKGKQVGEHQSQLSPFIIDNWMNLCLVIRWRKNKTSAVVDHFCCPNRWPLPKQFYPCLQFPQLSQEDTGNPTIILKRPCMRDNRNLFEQFLEIVFLIVSIYAQQR